jgi:hypothetical protein
MPGSSNATGQADVIILSDGDEYPAEKPNKASASKSKKKNNRQRGKARAKLLVPSGEIVDISSEDERPVVSLGVIADLQRQVQMLQKVLFRMTTA